MKKRRFIIVFLALIIILSTLTSCSACAYVYSFSEIKYNAKMYGPCNDWINPDFLEENKISNAFYPDPEYDEKNPDNPDHPYEYYLENSDVETRTFVINDKETFDQIFLPNTLSVDFEKQTAVLYISSTVSPRKCYIKRLLVEEEKITVYFKTVSYMFTVLDTVMPYARCLVVTMKKTDITNFEFVKEL